MAKADLPQVCIDCEVRFVCNGGCPKNREPVEAREARYVRVVARCAVIPAGASGAGDSAWLLVDQVVVS